MSAFTEISKAGNKEPIWDWGKPSLAIVACDGNGGGCVLHTVGPHVKDMIESYGKDLGDLGLDDAPEGLSVWEGKIKVSRCGEYGSETEVNLVGEFRNLNDNEWGYLRGGDDPWDEELWITGWEDSEP